MFDISFVGLKIGKHNFTYQLNNEFFEFYGLNEVIDGKVNAQLILDKKETMLLLDFAIDGYILLTCDLCMQQIKFKVKNKFSQVAKFTEEHIDDDIITIASNQYSINVGHNLYEILSFAIPFKRTCKQSMLGNKNCDKKMIKKLNDLSRKNKIKNDPRWGVLSNLKFN